MNAEKLRRVLAGSRAWADLVKELPLMAVAMAEPIDFEDCTDDEAVDIAAWATGAVEKVPWRLQKYIDDIKKAGKPQ